MATEHVHEALNCFNLKSNWKQENNLMSCAPATFPIYDLHNLSLCEEKWYVLLLCTQPAFHTVTGRVNLLVSEWKDEPQHPGLQEAAHDTLLSLE